MRQKSVIIIGSGFGGLSAAALLAKAGYAVTVLEKNEQPGGRAAVLKKSGFTFDMGPSWYTMPEVFDTFFAEFGKKTSQFYTLKKLSPQYRIFFDDYTHVEITGDTEKDEALFESFEKGAAKNLQAYLKESKLKYDISMKEILYKNMNSVFDLLSWNVIKNSFRMGIFQSLHNHVSSYFSHPKLQQILEYNIVFLGCSPKNAPALFSLMSHLDYIGGIWYPKGGLGTVVTAMTKLAEDQGVSFEYNTAVTALETSGSTITKVETSQGTYTADYIISNADYAHTENLLSDQSKRTFSKKAWDKKVLAPSAFLIYLGVKGKLPKLEHHNLYFGDDWDKHFKTVFDNPQWPVEPSIYINMPSKNDPTLAPKGHEALMVLVPIAPNLTENQEWKETYAEYIIRFIEKKLRINLQESIVLKEIFSISDFASRYNSLGGNALGGLAHTFFQSAVWRPANQSKKIDNLYFAGANTVPGIGVPTSVISGHLVRDLLVKRDKG